MIARVWRGVVPLEKADGYAEYDLECLLEPEPNVTHYEVLVG